MHDLARRRLLMATAAGMGAWATGCSTRDTAPQFGYTLLDGAKGSTDAMRGKVLLVNFWATSCVTCVKEMPAIADTYKKYAGRGFETLAVAMSYDPPAHVSNFAQTRGLPFGVVCTSPKARAIAPVLSMTTPTTFLIDKRGGTARRFVGEPDFAGLHQLVEKLLAEA
jgi:peroxiredoxin